MSANRGSVRRMTMRRARNDIVERKPVIVLAACCAIALTGLAAADAAGAQLPGFDKIRLADGELPGFRLGQTGIDNACWWVIFRLGLDPGEAGAVLERPGARKMYPCYTQWWHRPERQGTEARRMEHLEVRYGIFERPSLALSALRAYHNSIADMAFPTPAAIGDYSLRTVTSVSFARKNVLVHVRFDLGMTIESDAQKCLSDKLIARIDGNPAPAAPTTQELVDDLRILEFMGYMDKDSGIAGDLQEKVEAAQGALARGDKAAAAGVLKTMADELDAFVEDARAGMGTVIEPAAAQALVDEINALIATVAVAR